MAGPRTPLGAQWVWVSHTPVLQSIVVKLKLLVIATMTCKRFTYSQYLPPEYTPVPRFAFFHFSMEMKTAPGCMDTMQVLDLGS